MLAVRIGKSQSIKIYLIKMNSFLWIELIGLIAGCLGLIAWIPQLHTVWFKRLHEGVSLKTLFIILIALSLWFVYGFFREAWAVCCSNFCSGIAVSLIIYRVVKLRKQ